MKNGTFICRKRENPIHLTTFGGTSDNKGLLDIKYNFSFDPEKGEGKTAKSLAIQGSYSYT
ncbi:MAG: hypothetical protein R3B93_28500 [Bacteroidia bacterium]